MIFFPHYRKFETMQRIDIEENKLFAVIEESLEQKLGGPTYRRVHH